MSIIGWILTGIIFLFVITNCGGESGLGPGKELNCKVEITIPSNAPRDEPVLVDARIFDCI